MLLSGRKLSTILPPALALMLDNSVPPPMSPVPFKCCPRAGTQKERVIQCVGPLKGTAWDSSSTPSPSASILTGFYSQKLWGLLFLALESWAGGPSVGQGPLTPQEGPLQPRYPFQFLSATCGSGTRLLPISALSTVSTWLLL